MPVHVARIDYISQRVIDEENEGLDPSASNRNFFYHPQYVNAYEVDRAFGGHEEGGWWYDYGEPLSSIRVHNPEQANEAADYLVKLHGPGYEDGPDIGSVAHRGSLSVTMEDHPAKHYPSEQPHYE